MSRYLTPAQRVPGYLPYPEPVSNAGLCVPNEALMFWPQGQFAQPYFPPGHASFSQFEFPDSATTEDSAQFLVDDEPYAGPVVDSEAGTVTFTTFQYISLFAVAMAAGYSLRIYMENRNKPDSHWDK